ncbi:hypothetical protein V3C99_005286 [Haemonchus contortus]
MPYKEDTQLLTDEQIQKKFERLKNIAESRSSVIAALDVAKQYADGNGEEKLASNSKQLLMNGKTLQRVARRLNCADHEVMRYVKGLIESNKTLENTVSPLQELCNKRTTR